MGIRMTINDTDAVTLADLFAQLPHSKAAKEVAALTAERDLFKKETVSLAQDAIKYKSALELLSNAIHALSGEFDKPVSDNNTGKWLRLNESQKVARQLLEI